MIFAQGGRSRPAWESYGSRYGSSVPALLRFLERQGRIVQVETDRYYDRSALEAMIARLREALVPGRCMSRPSLEISSGSRESISSHFWSFVIEAE